MFIHGMKIAAASPIVPSLPSELAMPDAIPPFCKPTSNVMTLLAERYFRVRVLVHQ